MQFFPRILINYPIFWRFHAAESYLTAFYFLRKKLKLPLKAVFDLGIPRPRTLKGEGVFPLHHRRKCKYWFGLGAAMWLLHETTKAFSPNVSLTAKEKRGIKEKSVAYAA